MNSLRVEKKNIYRIEVNDNGECIEFDLEDIGLRTKLYKALEDLKKIEKEFSQRIKNVKNDKECAFLEDDMFKEMRHIMDSFLGEGACQKIFGDRNYADMYNDLFKELTKKRKELGFKSHFDMLQLSTKEINDKIMNKYKKSSKKVI